MFIENTFTVYEKSTGKRFDCFEQTVDLNFDGKMVRRYNVGINGYHYWTPIYMYYSDESLEKDYRIDLNSYAKYVGADEEQEAWFAKELAKRNEE